MKLHMPKGKIFISHAVKDKDLADKLVDVLLNNGCDVPVGEIFCTSLEGMGIPAGSNNFIQVIRDHIQQPSLVILLLTENYFCSTFCQCELGATWAMNLPTFPIVVPPLKKSGLKATLAVTQAGDVNDSGYLDELRDAVKEKHGAEVKTARWNLKKDLFLKELPDVLANLPKPAQVPAEKLKEAEQKYREALEELEEAEKRQKELGRQIEELKKLKDTEQVKVVAAKFSTADKEFGRLQQEAQKALKKLCRATRIALYWRMRDEAYHPEDQDAWDEVETAKAEREVWVNEDESATAELNDKHPRVQAADVALRELERFLGNRRQEDFVEELTKECEFPIELSNKEFWRNYLTSV